MKLAIHARWLGRRPYATVLELQRRLLRQRQDAEIDNVVLFVEHDPVITLGRGAELQHLLTSTEALAELGVDLATVERGGDITLHAPGQLVCYPILDLSPDRRDVRRYVSSLASAMNGVLRELGLAGGTVDGMVGLWVDRASPQHWPGRPPPQTMAKIGAIGVRISRWVTMHGYALNLCPDLSLFRLIVPCGISEYPVTSVHQLLGASPQVSHVVPLAFDQLATALDATATDIIDESEQSTLD